MGYTLEVFIGQDASGLFYAKLIDGTNASIYTSKGYKKKYSSDDSVTCSCIVNNKEYLSEYTLSTIYDYGTDTPFLNALFSVNGNSSKYTSFSYTDRLNEKYYNEVELQCSYNYDNKYTNYPQTSLYKNKYYNDTYTLDGRSTSGTVTYNSTNNSFTFYNNINQYTNYQNTSIIANAGLSDSLINKTTQSDDIINAMFAMNASVFSTLQK